MASVKILEPQKTLRGKIEKKREEYIAILSLNNCLTNKKKARTPRELRKGTIKIIKFILKENKEKNAMNKGKRGGLNPARGQLEEKSANPCKKEYSW